MCGTVYKARDADPHPELFFTSMRIRIQVFILMQIRNPDPDPHQSCSNLRPLVYRPSGASFFEPSRLHCESVNGALRLHFELLNLLNFDSNADLNPAFHSNAEPDPDTVSKNTVDPEPQP